MIISVNNRLNSKGRFLTYLLRHDPKKANLDMDEFGWVTIDQLLNNTDLTKDEIYQIVAEDNKQRFAIDENNQKIRANQGHSIAIDLALENIQPPDILYHGSGLKNRSSIHDQGILKMERQHVHLSADQPTALKVGRRKGKPIIFVIDTKQMYEDGIEFFLSQNGVWLVDYVNPKYIIDQSYQ